VVAAPDARFPAPRLAQARFAGDRRPCSFSPPISLLLIVATPAATSQTQARFFRDAVIGREAVIVRDMVAALALKDLSSRDRANFADDAAQARFAESFHILKNLSGVVRIKKILAEDSETCREFHRMDAIKPARKRGERAHAGALAKGSTICIACHYNLVHGEAPLTPRFQAAIADTARR
jgi:hypothetical protein